MTNKWVHLIQQDVLTVQVSNTSKERNILSLFGERMQNKSNAKPSSATVKKSWLQNKSWFDHSQFPIYFLPFPEQHTDTMLASQKQKSTGAHHLDISCIGSCTSSIRCSIFCSFTQPMENRLNQWNQRSSNLTKSTSHNCCSQEMRKIRPKTRTLTHNIQPHIYY